MDTGTLITAALFLILCMIVFWILSRSNYKREKKLLQSLRSLAAKTNHTIHAHDTWNDSVIGIDNTTGMLFIITTVHRRLSQNVVKLADMETCKIITTNKKGNHSGDERNAVERLELVLVHRDNKQPDIIITFYDTTSDGPFLTGELYIIKKWWQVVYTRLHKLPLQNAAL